MKPVRVSWIDIAGFEHATHSRLSAGPLLSMLDMCAARAAQTAADHVSRTTQERYLTCTVGVTGTVFSSPILHGDAVRLDGRVIHCGSSSLGVFIRLFRRSPTTRVETPAGHSFFTMVTITPDLKAAKIVPSMELTDPADIAMHHRYSAIRRLEGQLAAEAATRRKQQLTVDEVDCPINAGKEMRTHMSTTKCEANRIFFSSFLNNNNTVFGGELMNWMEKHAVHCGRMFTGNRQVYTIGMHGLSFNEPVFATDWVTLEAMVIYIRNSTMEIDVTLRAERKNSGRFITNRASFVLINNNDIGQNAAIPVGIDLQNATQDELQLFMEARARYHSGKDEQKKFNATLASEGMDCSSFK